MTTARTTTRGWLSLEERTALVTGAGTGSGRGIAHALAERGASVAVDDVASESAHAVVAEIAAAGGTAYAHDFDITDYDGVKAGVREAEERLGPIGGTKAGIEGILRNVASRRRLRSSRSVVGSSRTRSELPSPISPPRRQRS